MAAEEPHVILKVQTSLTTTSSEQLALIYDQTLSLTWEGPVSQFPGLDRAMGDDHKAFFEATCVANDFDGGMSITIGKKLPDQGW